MRSILIILFAVFTINSTQAQEGEPKEKNFGSLSFKQNEVFKRFGVFASANVLYYHSNYGIGFDCFLANKISTNFEVAVGQSYGVNDYDNSFDKRWNIKASLGLKYWPITKKRNNNIYPYFGVNFATTSVHFYFKTEFCNDELTVRVANVIETPIGLCYYKDGFLFSAHVGIFYGFDQEFRSLKPYFVHPFMSFQVGYRF
jgi:hypothetical protein